MIEEIDFEEGETRSEIIATCHYALACADFFDSAMLDEEDKKRVENIKRMSLILVEGYLSEIYYESYED
jgi:hypothetical protein